MVVLPVLPGRLLKVLFILNFPCMGGGERANFNWKAEGVLYFKLCKVLYPSYVTVHCSLSFELGRTSVEQVKYFCRCSDVRYLFIVDTLW